MRTAVTLSAFVAAALTWTGAVLAAQQPCPPIVISSVIPVAVSSQGAYRPCPTNWQDQGSLATLSRQRFPQPGCSQCPANDLLDSQYAGWVDCETVPPSQYTQYISTVFVLPRVRLHNGMCSPIPLAKAVRARTANVRRAYAPVARRPEAGLSSKVDATAARKSDAAIPAVTSVAVNIPGIEVMRVPAVQIDLGNRIAPMNIDVARFAMPAHIAVTGRVEALRPDSFFDRGAAQWSMPSTMSEPARAPAPSAQARGKPPR